MSDTPRVDAIALRLTGKTGLFCDDDSLAQYNDLVREARALERELAERQAAIDELVACKDLKDRIEARALSDYSVSNAKLTQALADIYARRKSLAWAVARALATKV